MEYEISVVIPVYNVEKTLRRCVESVLRQTFKNYEIILVDDGSPDNSGKICDEYAKKYEFISVIHKKNEGLGPTRDCGVRAARGKYIYHCDSDDWIKETTLEDAYNASQRDDSDVVLFGYTMYYEKNKELCEFERVELKDDVIYGKQQVIDFFLSNVNNYFIVLSTCNRLVKKSFLIDNNIWFKPFRRSQDIVFSYDLFDKLEKITVLGKSYYEYIIEPGKYKGRSVEEMIDIYLSVYEYLEERTKSWGRFEGQHKINLINCYRKHIANYMSFYLVNKAGNKKMKIIGDFVNDERVRQLFSEDITCNSTFIEMFRKFVMKKSRYMLYLLAVIQQRKIERLKVF